jgi:hypothetical protein
MEEGAGELRRSGIFVATMNHGSRSEPQRGGIAVGAVYVAPTELGWGGGRARGYKDAAPTELEPREAQWTCTLRAVSVGRIVGSAPVCGVASGGV